MNIVLGILAIALVILYGVAKAAFRVMKWLVVHMARWILIPTAFVAALVLGTLLSASLTGEDFAQAKIAEYTHQVTVYWDAECTVSDVFSVREDLNWTLDAVTVENQYSDQYLEPYSEQEQYAPPELPKEAYRTGYRFLGLFSSPYGVEQYVDSNGYSLKSVTSNITLYACWEKI